MPCITHETEQERREAARRHEQALTGPLHEEIDRLKAQLAEQRAQRAVERARILDALAARENEELTKASKEELLARLAQLDG